MSASRMPADVTVAVVGAGQAGLAISYYLTREGIDHVVVDGVDRIGDSWRARWDSLRLFTPARYDGLPGVPFPAAAGSFPSKDETADYLEAYVERHHLPVHLGERAEGLAIQGNRYVLTVGGRTLTATHVVVATGAHQTKKIPLWASTLDGAIRQLHAADYRNPGQLQPGPVLVVGAGNSGSEIAIEVAQAGHPTQLAGKSTGQLPKMAHAFNGLFFWFLANTIFSIDTPIGRKMRPQAQAHGGPLIRLTRKDVATAGVESVTRVTGTRNGRPLLQDGREVETANVIWCTGFGHDFTWIHVPGIASDSLPTHDRGVMPAQPGLYFIGLPFQTKLASAFLGGVGEDAQAVVETIASRLSNETPDAAPTKARLHLEVTSPE
jgi:putative flavoprotein involved in K+ transport